MPSIRCPIEGCTYATEDIETIGAVALLNIHAKVHQHPANAAPAPAVRGPKFQRPSIRLNVSSEDWNAFSRRWTTYRTGTGISDQSAASQLLECASEDLGDIVLRAYPDFTSKPMAEATRLLKSLAVVPVALGVLRSELASMQQGPDESFRTFAAKVQGKAETCEFTTTYAGTCSGCQQQYHGSTYYTDEILCDVLINGIADPDIRREALSSEGILQRSVNELIGFIESRETARDANPSIGMSTMSSSYRQHQKDMQQTPTKSPSPAERSKTGKCPGCGDAFNLYSEKKRGWNKKPHTQCASCWRKSNFPNSGHNTITAVPHDDPFGQIAMVSETPSKNIQQRHRRRGRRKPNRPRTINITHHAFTKGAWRRANLADHPRVLLSLTPDRKPGHTSKINGIADSGAQSDVWSLTEYLVAGYKMEDLLPVSLSLNAANKSPININGAFFTRVSGVAKNGTSVTCRTMVYVSSSVNGFYLSYSTMLGLGMLSADFPMPGCAHNDGSLNSIDSMISVDCQEKETCSCPVRGHVPNRPARLPFPCVPENNMKMEEWLCTRYASTLFNTCPHHPLPSMTGPPMDIHLKQDAIPYSRTKPVPIPRHWEQQIYDGLLRDEALGIIERVPYGEPVTWCHRMVPMRKPDGTVRRTIDMSAVNKQSKRET